MKQYNSTKSYRFLDSTILFSPTVYKLFSPFRVSIGIIRYFRFVITFNEKRYETFQLIKKIAEWKKASPF